MKVDQSSRTESNRLPVLSGHHAGHCLLERCLMMVVSVGRGIINSADINDNMCLVNECGVTSTDNVCRLIFGQQFEHEASQCLIGMEHAIMSGDGKGSGHAGEKSSGCRYST